ncbi:hypothetical protein HYH03_009632 [Edaphochlamys debaryana]|uniref:F-box domain-containing protein n=1 Tax=Edaphochlamys debaryana TaxID=47281 RepID=A0A835Y127_9CHLO|nr:hypothetical protein HYH03_009632 [Edaphochlamys debaryana]|eukprot:KAG2492141.1 hypothetical protein HYH03_009632 [Edaphochlamys debaryana]
MEIEPYVGDSDDSPNASSSRSPERTPRPSASASSSGTNSRTISPPTPSRSPGSASSTSSSSSSLWAALLDDWEAEVMRRSGGGRAAGGANGAAGSGGGGGSGGAGGSRGPASARRAPPPPWLLPPDPPLRRPLTAGPAAGRSAAASTAAAAGPSGSAPRQSAAAAAGPSTSAATPSPRSDRPGGGGGGGGSGRPGCGGGGGAGGSTLTSPRTPTSAGGGGLGGGGGALSPGSGGAGGGGAGGGRGSGPRRAAFVAGGVRVEQRKLEPVSPIGRDILLPRLPAPALALIVPALPPAARAALRASCRGLRELVDAHTQRLTLRPDRRAADGLNRRGLKAFTVFPALQHATVVLAGSGSGPSGPSPALSSPSSTASLLPLSASPSLSARSPRGRAPSASLYASSASLYPYAASAAAAAAARLPPSPLLPLSGWLVVCGVGSCLTSLELHVGEVALLEELALSVTHPHLQRLDLHIGRCGSPHAQPPVVQFMVDCLQGLRHLRLAWAGQAAPAAAASSLAHGPRRLFLDGRPRLGALLLGALGELPHLASLELQGFIIDTEGHAMLCRHWAPLAARLQRLVLSRLHLLVPAHAPPEQQLCELLGSCSRLTELSADLCLPAAANIMPAAAGGDAAAAAAGAAAAGGGGGGGAAAALLISLMYAARDVRAIKPELLPVSLCRLALPGVALTAPGELEALGRLTALTRLELSALGPGAAPCLRSLQELRLRDCSWAQLLDMLPWRLPGPPEAPQAQAQAQPGQPRAAWPAEAGGSGAGAANQAAGAGPGPLEAQAQARAGRRARSLGSGRAVDAPEGRDAGAVAEAVAAEPGGAGAGPPSPSAAAGTGADRSAAAEGGVSGAAGGGDAGGGGEAGAGGRGSPVWRSCGALRLLEVVVSERLDDWHPPDRRLLGRVGRALVPLADAGCGLRLKVAPDAQPHMWNESDEEGRPWEPEAVWRHIKAAQNLRRLKVETSALAERLARGRLLQAARRQERERPFVDR